MRKNDPYKMIKQLLEQVHLKPRKKDWEQMQALLNQELPLPKTKKLIKPVHYFFAASVAVVILTSVIILKHQHALNNHVNANNSNLTSDSALNNVTTKKNNNAVDSISEPTSENNYAAKNDSVSAISVGTKNKETVKQDNNSSEKHKKSSTVNKDNAVDYDQQLNVNNKKHNPDRHDQSYFSNRRNSNDNDQDSITKKEGLNTYKPNEIAGKKTNTNDIVLTEKSDSSFQQKINAVNSTDQHDNNTINKSSAFNQNKNETSGLNNKPVLTDNSNAQQKIKIPITDTVQTLTQANKNVNPSPVQKQKSSNGKVRQKNAGGFNYGLQLTPLEFFPDADKKINNNYIPGLLGEYLFTKKFGVHVDVSPYASSNIKTTQIFTDSAFNNDTVSNSTYYLSKLRAINTEFAFVYKLNHFSVEAGVGLQNILSGKGEIESKRLFDSSGFATTSSKIFYHNSDVAFKSVNKSMLNYHLTVLYKINHCQIGIGYYQNAKGWIKENSLKPTGSLQLQLRYIAGGKHKSKP